MRLTLLIICVCLAGWLTGQRANPFGKGLQISLTLQPDLQQKFTLTPYVTAADTLPFDRTGFRGNFSRRPDTIRLNGNETLYWYESALSREAELERALFSLLSRFQLHYRFGGGLELTCGVYYSAFTTRRITRETDGLPNDFYYFSSESRTTRGGAMTGVFYNFRRNSRLQPYVGLRLFVGLNHFEVIDQQRTFPGLNEEITSLPAGRFRENTILELDLDIPVGFNVQVSDNWAIGLEAYLNRYLLPVPAALQIRYRFGMREAE